MNTDAKGPVEYGSPQWFRDRAKTSLIKINNNLWDYSDSALFWTDEVVKKYEDAQTIKDDNYKKQVTDKETTYLKKNYSRPHFAFTKQNKLYRFGSWHRK